MIFFKFSIAVNCKYKSTQLVLQAEFYSEDVILKILSLVESETWYSEMRTLFSTLDLSRYL